jgi:serine/threonine-protein kinase
VTIVTDRHSNGEPREEGPDHGVPLRLEETSDGSTQPVEAETESDAAEPIESGDEPATEASKSATPGSSTSESGGTTGGFETMLGKLVVRAGLVTKDEVDLCNNLLKDSTAVGDPQTLSDLLISKDYLTRHQLGRLRQEFEAQKSSQRIPGYKIRKKLGSGAMATVFLAQQLSLDRPVAIKILPKRFSDNEKFIDRFYKEGRAAAKLNHPNIVSAYDVGRAGEHHYFVMEYVDGRTVHDRIARDKRIPEQEAAEIVKQVAKALKHAHERGFVHRDIKPKNIMIARNGIVKLADLGLARAISDEAAAKAEAGRAYGTPYYISPEQIRGEVSIGPAADIYGLGATFYHMVTGRVPFEGKNPSAVMHKHLRAPLQPPDHINPEISAGCAQVIEMMMAKKPRDRYQGADDLLQDLELLSQGEPPHFAHRSLDHAAITEAITDVADTPIVIAEEEPPHPEGIAGNPLLMVLAVLLIFSLIANVIMFTIVFSGG